MVAELGDSNGWKRTIELTPPTTFTGNAFSAEGVLSLAQAQSLIAILEEQSGVKNEKYSVVLKPQVEMAGTISGTRFEDTFAPELPMALDKVELKMDARQDNQTPLAPRTEGLVQTLQSETNTISLLALSMPVAGARALALAGLGVVLALSGWLIMSFVHRAGREHGGATGKEHLRNSVVNVRGTVPASRTRVVDVASLDDLGRIASKLGVVVLQEARPGYHAYFVHDMDLTYRYEALGTEQEHSTEPIIPRKIA